MAVVKIMEGIVKEKVDSILEKTDCCKCDVCKQDMLAFALNMLEPKYVNSNAGELFGKLDSSRIQNMIDIDIAVAKAIATVSSSPRHK